MASPPTDNAAAPPSNGRPKTSKEAAPGRPRWWPQPWWLIFLLFMVVNYVVTQVFFPEPSSITIPYTFFKQQVEAGNVEDVTSVGDSIQGSFKTKVTYPPETSQAPTANAPAAPPADQPKARTSMQFKTQRPAFADQDLERRLEDKGVVIKAVDENASSWFKLLVGFGPTLLLIAAFVWISRRASAAAGGGLFSLGRSRAKRYSEEQPKVTFDDVAGIDEAENELIEIVDFLKNPTKYQRLGGTVPKGVLLVGAPGTGKTLLARAIAGQAGVPFFSLSASEFIEMIVAVGAARVRDLFKQAREAALLAARKEANAVGAEDFAEALQKITSSAPRSAHGVTMRHRITATRLNSADALAGTLVARRPAAKPLGPTSLPVTRGAVQQALSAGGRVAPINRTIERPPGWLSLSARSIAEVADRMGALRLTSRIDAAGILSQNLVRTHSNTTHQYHVCSCIGDSAHESGGVALSSRGRSAAIRLPRTSSPRGGPIERRLRRSMPITSDILSHPARRPETQTTQQPAEWRPRSPWSQLSQRLDLSCTCDDYARRPRGGAEHDNRFALAAPVA